MIFATDLPAYQDVFELAYSNFEYVSDINQYRVPDKWVMHTQIDKLFRGDCEDFSFTLQYQIGGDVWYIVLPDKQAHAALVKDGYVYGNLHPFPVELEKYNGEFIGTLNYTHHTINISGTNYYFGVR